MFNDSFYGEEGILNYRDGKKFFDGEKKQYLI